MTTQELRNLSPRDLYIAMIDRQSSKSAREQAVAVGKERRKELRAWLREVRSEYPSEKRRWKNRRDRKERPWIFDESTAKVAAPKQTERERPAKSNESERLYAPKPGRDYYRVPNALYAWKLPMHPTIKLIFGAMYYHANNQPGRIVKAVTVIKIGEECCVFRWTVGRALEFLCDAGLIVLVQKSKQNKQGEWMTAEYRVPWLHLLNRDEIVAKLKKLAKGGK